MSEEAPSILTYVPTHLDLYVTRRFILSRLLRTSDLKTVALKAVARSLELVGQFAPAPWLRHAGFRSDTGVEHDVSRQHHTHSIP